MSFFAQICGLMAVNVASALVRRSCAIMPSGVARNWDLPAREGCGSIPPAVWTAVRRGPVIAVYPEAVWYTYIDREDIDEIIEEHLQNGRVVERLRI